MPTKRDYTIIALLLIFAALALTGTADAEDAQKAHDQHCEMVAIWAADKAANVAPEQRRGWPNYDNRKCEG